MNKKKLLHLFFSFSVFRLFLEAFSWPFTVGFDTLAFYLPNLLGYGDITWLRIYSWAPLYYLIVSGMCRVLGDVLIAIKVFAVLLQGLFGVCLYSWSVTLFKDNRKALFFSFLAGFYFATLRLMWDLHRNVLGLIFMFLTLWVVDRWDNRFSVVVSGVLGCLAALSHQIVPLLLVAVLVVKVLRGSRSSFSALICALVAWFSVIYASSLVKETTVSRYLGGIIFEASEGPFPSGFEALGFLLYILLPLFPFFVVGFVRCWRRREVRVELVVWLVFCVFLGLFWGLGFRLILLVPFPVMFYAVHVGKRLRVILFTIVFVFALGYVLFPCWRPFPYFCEPFMWDPSFRCGLPSSLLQNTVPLDVSDEAFDVALYAVRCLDNDSRGVLLVNRVFIGYVLLAGAPHDRVVLYGEGYVDPMPWVENLTKEGYVVYFVWWLPNYDWYGWRFGDRCYGFEVVFVEEPFAVYRWV